MGFQRKLHGGRSEGHAPAEFATAELIRGTIHETEHTDDPMTAMEIAMDHLIEHPDYYEVLEAAEKQMRPSAHLMRARSDDGLLDEASYVPNFVAAVGPEAAVLAREAPAMAQAVRAAAPEIAAASRVVVPRTAGWIARAARALKQGWSESRVIKSLVDSGIPKRAAVAIEQAAQSFLAAELQTAATKAASRVVGRRKLTPNSGYYAWVVNRNLEPVEGPYGPHTLLAAKTFARISATKGTSARAVSRGKDPFGDSFEVVRIYAAGTGTRVR